VILEIFLAGCIVGFSILLMITSLLSYSRLHHVRFIFLAGAFLLFLIQGILILIGLLIEDLKGNFTVSSEFLFFSFLILIFLYLAVAKK